MAYNITITCETDYDNIPVFCFSAAEDVAWVKQQLEDGNEWAWCIVTVSLEFPSLGITLSDSIEGCSYESEEQFKQGGQYDKMVVSLKQKIVDACLIIVKDQFKI